MSAQIRIRKLNRLSLFAVKGDIGIDERQARLFLKHYSLLLGLFREETLIALFSFREKVDKNLITLIKLRQSLEKGAFAAIFDSLGEYASSMNDNDTFFQIDDEDPWFSVIARENLTDWEPLIPFMLSGKGYARRFLEARILNIPFRHKDFSIVPWERHDEYPVMTYMGDISWIPDALNPFLMKEIIHPATSFIMIIDGEIAGWYVNSCYAKNVYNIESSFVHPVYRKKLYQMPILKFCFQKMREIDEDSELVWIVLCDKHPEVVDFYQKYFSAQAEYMKIVYRSKCTGARVLNPPKANVKK